MLDALFEFDELGILRATHVPPVLEWMNATQIDLLLAVYLCGQEGMSRGRTQRFDEPRTDAMRGLELRDYLHWERNRFGRLAFLCLTWKGLEAARLLVKVARNELRASPETSRTKSPTCSS
jgi:hypothetical protein